MGGASVNPADEFRALRNRLGPLADAIDRADRDRPQGVPRYAGRVFSGGAIPTSIPKVFVTHPLAFTATESEGSTPTLTPDTSRSVPVLVLGPGVPVAGDDLIARQVQGRWVAGMSASAPPVQCGTITYTIRGCFGNLLSGATVTVYDGNNNTFPVLTTGTTNSSGVYVAAIFAAKTYYYEVSHPRFVTQNATVAAACSGSSNTAAPLTLTTPAAGYVCTSPGCAVPFASTWHLTDSAGTISLTWNGAFFVGSHTYTRAGRVLVGGVCTANASVTGDVTYRLDPPATSGSAQLLQSWRICGVPGVASFSDATGTSTSSVSALAATSCAIPSSYSFTLPGTAVFDAGAVVTVSE